LPGKGTTGTGWNLVALALGISLLRSRRRS
jgi:MYXO-CTERM domain-containing protein